ncbi:hypothetical protein [Marinobacterium marinum]|uniref:Uncharacterized protein n=1 Tax=Marinobacterium marinum TaxID=2756129 RepID=A0A7W1WYU4_9GAMM|nr:hypothetical protein [Marinobacterium marinum]MBA4502567.1 hypothetical protein [Marinobacterium marinum]
MKKFAMLLILFFSAEASAEESDILKIYEHFTLSGVAAEKCINTKEEELTSFLANYQMVSVFALTELRNQNPDLSSDQAQAVLNIGGEKIEQLVYEMIENDGCESSKIQDLIKRFHMLAEWKP